MSFIQTYSEQVAAQVRGTIAAKKGVKVAPTVLLAGVLDCTTATAATRLDGSIPLDVIELMKIASWLEVDLHELLPAPTTAQVPA